MDKLALVLKYVAGFFLLIVLAGFTYVGKVSADVLVAVVTACFGAIGVHAAYSKPADGEASAPNDKQAGFISLESLGFLCGMAGMLALVVGCASSLQVKTPEQIASDVQVAGTKFCALAQPTLASLSLLQLDAKGTAALATATGVVTVVCKAGAVIDASGLASLANTALPQIVAAIKSADMSDDDKNKAILGVSAANVAINSALTAAGAK